MRPLSGLAIVLLGFALLLTGCAKLDFWRRSDSPAPLAEGPRVGTAAPEIEGIDFEGRPLKLTDYRGKVVVVAFWASHCRPCVKLIPYERSLAERYRDKPFAILGVNLDGDPDRARNVIASQCVSWRCWVGGGQNSVANRWNVTAIPALFVIDAQGIIRHANVHGPSLDRAVATLVAEAEKKSI